MTAETPPGPGGIIVVAGPTSAGKTELAVRLAEAIGGEIISADSRQIYRGLEIGAGKPDPEQLRRVPHHLISAAPPQQVVTAADFAARAEAARRDIAVRGKAVLLVGGTGLWIRAFMDGLADTPPPDRELRSRLAARAEAEGAESLHRELQAVDPTAAARLHPADRVRIIRALEIYSLSGRRPSELPKTARPPRPGLWLGAIRPRAELYARAEARIDAWLEAGWAGEVKSLLASGLTPETPAMQALGYAHLARCARGECTQAQAVEWIKRDTRRYIKRQLTWFLAEPRIHWIEVSGEDAAAEARRMAAAAGWK